MLHLFGVFVFACVHIYTDACVWVVKGNLQGSAFLFHPEVPRTELGCQAWEQLPLPAEAYFFINVIYWIKILIGPQISQQLFPEYILFSIG